MGSDSVGGGAGGEGRGAGALAATGAGGWTGGEGVALTASAGDTEEIASVAALAAGVGANRAPAGKLGT